MDVNDVEKNARDKVEHSLEKCCITVPSMAQETLYCGKSQTINDSKEKVTQTCRSVNVRKFYEYHNKFILLIFSF